MGRKGVRQFFYSAFWIIEPYMVPYYVLGPSGRRRVPVAVRELLGWWEW